MQTNPDLGQRGFIPALKYVATPSGSWGRFYIMFQIEGYSLTHVHLRDGVWTGMETYGSICRCFGPLYYLVLLVQTS